MIPAIFCQRNEEECQRSGVGWKAYSELSAGMKMDHTIGYVSEGKFGHIKFYTKSEKSFFMI